MKKPDECAGLNDVRLEIDRIDKGIIASISDRFEYVKRAARFKTSEKDVRAPDRLRTMLKRRRAWAKEKGLPPDVIEKLFSDLVSHFIREEMDEWKQG